MITREKVEMIKAQLHELLTGYGPITALIIDGWATPACLRLPKWEYIPHIPHSKDNNGHHP